MKTQQLKPEQFRERREFLSMTQQELANRLGLSRRAIQYYESGEQHIPRTVMLAMQSLELERK